MHPSLTGTEPMFELVPAHPYIVSAGTLVPRNQGLSRLAGEHFGRA